MFWATPYEEATSDLLCYNEEKFFLNLVKY